LSDARLSIACLSIPQLSSIRLPVTGHHPSPAAKLRFAKII